MLSLGGPPGIVLPNCKFAILVAAKEAALHFCNFSAAPGAATHGWGFLEMRLFAGRCTHQFPEHTPDARQKILGGVCALLHLPKSLLPARRHLRGPEGFRQQGNDLFPFGRGQQHHAPAFSLALHVSALHQFLQRSGTGGGGSQSLVPRPRLLRPCGFHGPEQGGVRIPGGRGGLSCMHCRRNGQLLSFPQLRQLGRTLGGTGNPAGLQMAAEGFAGYGPAHLQDLLPLGRELRPRACQRHRGIADHAGFAQGAQQAQAYQVEQVQLAPGQRRQVGPGSSSRGQQRMVIRHLRVVHGLPGMEKKMQPVSKGHGGLHICRQRAKPRRHVLGQIPTVRSGIRQQLLFVQGLGIVQGLLRRIPIDAVGIPLQGGQVVEFGRLHHAPGCLDAAYGGTLSLAGALYRLRLLAVGKALALRGEAALQLHGIERLRMKGGNLLLPLHQQRQGGRHDPTHLHDRAAAQGE